MHRLPGFDHQPGRHCGSAALRNLAKYYDWDYSEPVCFGVGGGVGFVTTDEGSWRRFRPCSVRLERAFFENLDVPHLVREDEDFEQAWGDVTDRLDDHDPVLLYLDPDGTPYLDDDHRSPHVVLAIGYDEHTVLLSDASTTEPQGLSLSTFREAWITEGSDDAYGFVAVTRPETLEDMQTAATRGIRTAAMAMTSPLDAEFSTGGPGEEGIEAMRSYAAGVPAWESLPRPSAPVAAAVEGVRWHGEDDALRGLYADAIDELSSWARIGGGRAGTMRDVADQWQTVGELFEAANRDPGDPADELAEAASVLGAVADREEAFFEDVLDAL